MVITYIVKKLTYLCILRKFLSTLGVESKIPDFLLHQFQHKTRLNGLCKRMNSRSVLWIDYHPNFPFLLSSQLCPRVSYIFGNILLWFPVTLQNKAKCVLDLFCCINVMTYFDIWFITTTGALLDRKEDMVVCCQDPIGLYKKKSFIFHTDQKLMNLQCAILYQSSHFTEL